MGKGGKYILSAGKAKWRKKGGNGGKFGERRKTKRYARTKDTRNGGKGREGETMEYPFGLRSAQKKTRLQGIFTIP